MTHTNEIAKSSWMLTLASIAVVIAALYLAKGLLVPLTLAVLLSFLLSPVCDWLERRRLGRIPAVLVTAILGFTMLGIVAWTAAVQMTHLAPKIPEYQQNIEAKLKLGERVCSRRAEQDDKNSRGNGPESLAIRTGRRSHRDRRTALTRSAFFPRQRARCKSLAACSAHCSRCWAPPASSSCLWCSS